MAYQLGLIVGVCGVEFRAWNFGFWGSAGGSGGRIQFAWNPIIEWD